MAPATTVEAAFEFFTRPRRHQRTDAERVLLAQAERSLVSDGVEQLAVWSWGAGPIVLTNTSARMPPPSDRSLCTYDAPRTKYRYSAVALACPR